MNKVVELGLVSRRRNASPVITNSPFQWLLMYSDLKHLGYNPYAPEFCRLIRSGKASRSMWKVLFPVLNLMIRKRVFLGKQVTQTAQWLDLELNELKMNTPHASSRMIHIHPTVGKTLQPKGVG